jgi:hypothetical protein
MPKLNNTTRREKKKEKLLQLIFLLFLFKRENMEIKKMDKIKKFEPKLIAFLSNFVYSDLKRGIYSFGVPQGLSEGCVASHL